MKKISLKDLILEKVNDLEIFYHYLGKQIPLGKAVVSPLREEKHASFNLYQASNGKIYFRDFAGDRGDCFKFVMLLYDCSFKDALEIVANDFKIEKSSKNYIRKIKPKLNKLIISPKTLIKTNKRNWNNDDMSYFNRYHITKEVLEEYETYPLESIEIIKGDRNIKIKEYPSNPMYGWHYEEEIWKIYRPFEKNKKHKFLSNTRSENIFGINQIKNLGYKLNMLIICAGQKDCLSLYSNTSIRGIALNSESAHLPQNVFIDLMEYTNNLLICYDNDSTGIRNANKIKEETGIDCINLPVEGDDISRFFKNNKIAADEFFKKIKDEKE